jgi:hypothetical protein
VRFSGSADYRPDEAWSAVVKQPFHYEITKVAVVAIAHALHDRLGEAAEATLLEKAFAL